MHCIYISHTFIFILFLRYNISFYSHPQHTFVELLEHGYMVTTKPFVPKSLNFGLVSLHYCNIHIFLMK